MTSDEAKQLIRRTFDEWMGSAETVEAWASRLERAIAGLSTPQSATVEEIAGIIQRGYNNWTDAESIAREIAARIPAPAVPAEIVERAKNVINRAQEISGIAMASSLINQALAVLRDLAAQPTPAHDPEAVELAKRLPPADQLQWFISEGDLKAFPYRKYRQALSDAAAFVRRAAGEPGA